MSLALEKSAIIELCHTCGGELIEAVEYRRLPRVSSDCKPVAAGGQIAYCSACGAIQKPLTESFVAEIGRIYAEYDVYYQGGGMEQMVYDQARGCPVRRSDLLGDRLMATGHLPHAGRAIDIGCGNGAFLHALSDRLADWRFNALELDRHHEVRLAAIPRFDELIVGEPDKISGQFDLISIIHAFEHFCDPLEALETISRHLAPGGQIFIQIPNASENPFDLLVADHVLHLTPQSLKALLTHQGYEITLLTTDWVLKEISVLARPGKAPSPFRSERSENDLCTRHISWLESLLACAHETSKEIKPFGIFGTSIAATWLTSALGDRIDFYIDDDQSRRSQPFFGKPVFRAEDAPKDARVFVGLAPVIANIIAKRLESSGLTAIVPPRLPAV